MQADAQREKTATSPSFLSLTSWLNSLTGASLVVTWSRAALTLTTSVDCRMLKWFWQVVKMGKHMLQNIQARQKVAIIQLYKKALACGIIILQLEKKLAGKLSQADWIALLNDSQHVWHAFFSFLKIFLLKFLFVRVMLFMRSYTFKKKMFSC